MGPSWSMVCVALFQREARCKEDRTSNYPADNEGCTSLSFPYQILRHWSYGMTLQIALKYLWTEDSKNRSRIFLISRDTT